MSRAQQQRHGLRRHDGEVFGGREVRDAKGVPEDDVGVVDRGGAVGDPRGESGAGLPRRLRDVAARRVQLVVRVGRHV